VARRRDKGDPWTAPAEPATPPERPTDEAVLLGYLLLRGPHPDAIDAIQPHLLSHVGHRLILRALTGIRQAGTEPCPIATVAALERSGDLEAAGGRGYVGSLIDGVVGGPLGWPMLAPYLRAVRTAATRRRLALLTTDLAAAAQNGHEPEELVGMASAIAELAATPDGQRRLPWIDLTTPIEPGRWLARNLIPEQGRMLLVAESGAGKSWVLEDLALCVASGLPWLGLEEEFPISGNSGPVLIVDEESAANRIKYRIARIAAGRGLTIHDFADSLHVCGLVGVKTGNTDSWRLLVSEVRRLRPCLVILDAAIRFIQGSEDKAEFVGPFWTAIGELQVHGTAVAIAHHTGWQEKDRPRGSTDWKGGADVVLTLTKTDNKDRAKLSWIKVKDPDGPADPEPIWIDRSGHLEVTLTCGGTVDDDKPTGLQLDASIMEMLTCAGGYVSRDDLIKRFAANGRSTVDRAIKRLKDGGRIVPSLSGYAVA
jgi:replicative DNA helicase